MTRPPQLPAGGRVVAMIPARGASKGVPGKNLRKVGGVSLVARAVASALAAELVDEVYVSTDDGVIAAAARAAGARVIDRPAELSGDMASSETALLHGLDLLSRDSADGDPGILVFLQATSPFIRAADLDAAITRVRDGESDVVLAARPSHGFLWRDTPDGAAAVNHDHSVRLRRQDSEPQFLETGAFYVMRVAGFRAGGFRFFGRIGLGIVPELTALEIDSEDDLALARSIAFIVERPERIPAHAVVTDFDGVHTDDRVHVGPDGVEFVTASRSDGMGVELLRKAGVPVLILSKERNLVVAARAGKLGVEVQQSLDDKRSALVGWAAGRGLDLASVAYLGNDVNDLQAMDAVGWPVAVADAHPAVLVAARVVLSSSGGHGAVRELADRILEDRPSPSTTEES